MLVIPGDAAFLQALREATAAHDVLLVFDEVMTARLAPGGMQEALGIDPDLTTLAKFLGGGLPFGAFGGRAELMSRFDPSRSDALPHGGTFNNDVLTMAAEKKGYTLWGLTPFARAQKENERALEPLVYSDPILQRLMVTIIVSREKIPNVNFDGAHALQSYLLEPSTQAKMHATKYPGLAHSAWAPAGRHNRYAILPKT